jgi:hypothetical protein
MVGAVGGAAGGNDEGVYVVMTARVEKRKKKKAMTSESKFVGVGVSLFELARSGWT